MSKIENITDEELLQQIHGSKDFSAAERKSVLSAVLARHYNWIFKMCFAHLKNSTFAEDCTQEIMLQAVRSIDSFKFKSKFNTWLYTVTKRTILKSKIKNLLLINKLTDQEVDQLPSFQLQEESSLWQDIQKLPERQKDILILHYFEDKSVEQISELTGLASGTIKTHLFKARNNLKKYIEA